MQKEMNSLIRIPLFFAAFILLGLIFGYITFKLLSFSRTVEVPSLTSMTLVEANEALNRAGLYLKIEGEDYDASVLSGKIIRQDIPAGNKVKEKRAIKVVISKGPRVSSVPSLVDETLGEAEGILIQKGLRIGRALHVHSDSVEKGRIVAQKPEPDERLSDTITVLVSLGPHELSYSSPDFINKTLDEAKEIAGKIGLVVEARGTGDTVRSQRPKPGTPVKSGETVYLETKEDITND
ncbi:MAG: PASTA domain-containing protein [Nitrospirae bacterium]|nr:PASTA domain-containing protein [Nitrospirota bacterium]